MKQFWIKQDEKYQEKIIARNQENGKKGGRPPKEKPKKPNGLKWNPKNPSKPKETLTDTDTVISVSNDTDDISKDISVNTNILSILKYNNKIWQIEKIDIEYDWYGNAEVNQVMAMVAMNNDWAMDGTKAGNRQFANNLVKKIRDIPAVKEGKTEWQAVLATILWVMKDDKFYGAKLTSPENIHRNFGTLMAETRKKLTEKKKSDFKSF